MAARNKSGEGEIRFGAAIAGRTLRVPVRASPESNWWEVIEEAFLKLTSTEEGRALYGDPQKGGATLEQAWRAQSLVTGMAQVCLLGNGRRRVSTAAIPQTFHLTVGDLVDTLAHACAYPKASAQALIFDGHAGHCIVLFGYDAATSSFVYFDPWPDRSFLCAENNAAGVAAQPVEARRWRVTSDELGSVIYAAFLWPTTWADLTGVSYMIQYADLKASDFWSFFHIREISRQEDDYEECHLRLAPGGFLDAIDLGVTLDASERLTGGSLALSRAWIFDQANRVNPFAADIARSFVSALTPTPDRADCEPFIQGLSNLRGGRLDDLPDPSSPAGQFLLAFIGTETESKSFMTFSVLSVEGVKRTDGPWVRLEMNLW